MSRSLFFRKYLKPSYGLLCLTLCACASVSSTVGPSGPNGKQGSNPWAAIKKPVLLGAKPEAFGFYSYGCLSGGVELPISGPFWEVVNTSRNRYYAHPDAAEFLEMLGSWSFVHGKLLLGDVAQPTGGPTSFGHASHQQGLDIDVRFGFAPGPLSPEYREGYPLMAVAMHYMDMKDEAGVKQFRLVNEITADWHPIYGDMIKTSASHVKVDRIFVSPPIKRELCSRFKVANGRGGYTYPGWLTKVRPYYEHNAHFHVRLRCPADSPGCEPQKPNNPDPTDSSLVGCAGSEFAWWFESDPAKPGYLKDSMDAYIKRAGAPEPMDSLDWESKHKKLPPACLELLKKAQSLE